MPFDPTPFALAMASIRIPLKSPLVIALIIIFTAWELRGSKHGHPLPKNPNPLVPVGVAAAPGTAGPHNVRAGGQVTANGTGGKVGRVGGMVAGRIRPAVVGARGAKVKVPADVVAVVADVAGGKVAPGGRVIKGKGVLRGRDFLKS